MSFLRCFGSFMLPESPAEPILQKITDRIQHRLQDQKDEPAKDDRPEFRVVNESVEKILH